MPSMNTSLFVALRLVYQGAQTSFIVLLTGVCMHDEYTAEGIHAAYFRHTRDDAINWKNV